MQLGNSSIFDCSIIEVPKIQNAAGNISVVENGKNIPFSVKRIYYLYDIPGGEERGGHAHYQLEQYIVAASGGFDVVLDDGNTKKTVGLNRPNVALHIKSGIWRELENFSSGSICMVLASMKYAEEDYIRNFDEYKRLKIL